MSIEKKIIIGLGLAVLLIGMITWFAHQQAQRYLETRRLVDRTNEDLALLADVLSTVKDVETSARGYILSGKEDYLEPYNASIKIIDQKLAHFRKLTAGDPGMIEKLDRLAFLIEQKNAVAKEQIELRRKMGFEAALLLVQTDKGKQLMDQIRELVYLMQGEENRLLKQRMEEEDKHARKMIHVSFGLGFAILALVVLVYCAFKRDFTARQRAEEELSKQTRILKSVLNSIGEGVVVADLSGKFLVWNPAAERIINMGPIDLPPDQWTEHYGIYLPDQITPYPTDRLPLARAIRGESVDGDEQFLRHANAPQGMWLNVTGRPLIDESGVSRGGVVVFTDTTERKQAEDAIRKLNEDLQTQTVQIEAANKELEAFSYSVSHDLRAPLRAIDGFGQALLEDYNHKLDEQGKGYVHRVRAATQRMAQLIDDLLNLSRVTRTEIHRETVDLSEIARTIAAELQRSQPERQVELAISERILATGDSRLLKVVLDNLLGNAWKFTAKRARARIQFGVSQDNGTLAYFVRDDGAGFDMEYANKLFGAFQRLHAITEFPGTGIGLATVQRIVHRHGGRIWAEGAVGKGATFYFTLLETKEELDGKENYSSGRR